MAPQSSLGQDITTQQFPPAAAAAPQDAAMEALLRQTEEQIANGHTATPPEANALQTWQQVIDRAFPATPAKILALSNFAAHNRDQAVDETTAGRANLADAYSMFADLAIDLLVHAGQTVEQRDAQTPAAPQTAAPPPAYLTIEVRPTAVATPDNPVTMGTPANERAVTLDLHLRRGDEMLASKDISGARKYYEYAAKAGSARAAYALAKTYDPAFLAQIATVGLKPEPDIALQWYMRAAALGDPQAAARLKTLSADATR